MSDIFDHAGDAGAFPLGMHTSPMNMGGTDKVHSMKKLYVFDLDGTLANSEHRVHLIGNKEDPDRWKKFTAASVHDLPNEPLIRIFIHLVEAGCEILIVTGRSDEVKAETITWLRRHIPVYMDYDRILIMRREGDHCQDIELKTRWYNSLTPAQKENLVAVFEDRARVVAMWRDLGVMCFQVAPGEF